MTHDYYVQERERLLEVLEDAKTRGDIYLEYDVREALTKLMDTYYEDSDE